MQSGDIFQYKGTIVAIVEPCGHPGGMCWVNPLFGKYNPTLISENQLLTVDPEVLNLVSLFIHAPQMTHDEIKIQIMGLFRGEP